MRIGLELGLEPDPDADDLQYVLLPRLAAGPPGPATGRDPGFEAGAVVIDTETGSGRIVDALRYAVAGLCLRSVPELLAGRAYSYQCFDSLREVRLSPDGALVRITGPGVDELSCPRADLAAAFVAAGGEFIDLMPQILPGYQAYLDTVERDYRAARAALLAQSGSTGPAPAHHVDQIQPGEPAPGPARSAPHAQAFPPDGQADADHPMEGELLERARRAGTAVDAARDLLAAGVDLIPRLKLLRTVYDLSLAQAREADDAAHSST